MISMKTECGYLCGWIIKRSHTPKSHQKMVNPIDLAGNTEEAEEEEEEEESLMMTIIYQIRKKLFHKHLNTTLQPKLRLSCLKINPEALSSHISLSLSWVLIKQLMPSTHSTHTNTTHIHKMDTPYYCSLTPWHLTCLT